MLGGEAGRQICVHKGDVLIQEPLKGARPKDRHQRFAGVAHRNLEEEHQVSCGPQQIATSPPYPCQRRTRSMAQVKASAAYGIPNPPAASPGKISAC